MVHGEEIVVWCLIVSIPDLCPLSYFEKYCGFFAFKYIFQLNILGCMPRKHVCHNVNAAQYKVVCIEKK